MSLCLSRAKAGIHREPENPNGIGIKSLSVPIRWSFLVFSLPIRTKFFRPDRMENEYLMSPLTSFQSIKTFKLYISPYTLQFKNKKLFPHSLEGSLLAFDFGSDLLGYSDFLPWPAFGGEQSLFHQLTQIQQGHFSNRFLIAKHNAFLDAQARQEKRNLFFGLKIPPSHFLIEDLLNFDKEKQIQEKGFKTVKVKLKAQKIPQQTDKLKSLYSELRSVKWRLDLNGQSWSAWKHILNVIKEGLDFIEDPFLDTGFQKGFKELFAEDWIPYPLFSIKIAKPSRDSLESLLKGTASSQWQRVVFTHSFDHPLGQIISAFWAGRCFTNIKPLCLKQEL